MTPARKQQRRYIFSSVDLIGRKLTVTASEEQRVKCGKRGLGDARAPAINGRERGNASECLGAFHGKKASNGSRIGGREVPPTSSRSHKKRYEKKSPCSLTGEQISKKME